MTAKPEVEAPLIEYVVRLRDAEAVVIEAIDFNHAVTEAVDMFGWQAITAILPA